MEFEPESKRPFIYLGCPYQHKEIAIEDAREELATIYAGMLGRYGFRVFSPLTHSVPIYKTANRCEPYPGYYIDMDLEMLKSGLFTHAIMLVIPGFPRSFGCKMEVDACKELGVQVAYSDVYAFGGAHAMEYPALADNGHIHMFKAGGPAHPGLVRVPRIIMEYNYNADFLEVAK